MLSDGECSLRISHGKQIVSQRVCCVSLVLNFCKDTCTPFRLAGSLNEGHVSLGARLFELLTLTVSKLQG